MNQQTVLYEKRTPLCFALGELAVPTTDPEKRRIDVVRILLEHNADPNITDADGRTALDLAVEKGYRDVACLLIEHGANPQSQGEAVSCGNEGVSDTG